MNDKETILAQKEEWNRCVKAILSSKSSKKIILSGAGTGKTTIFKELLKTNSSGRSVVMTFIRSLTDDMDSNFGNFAEVKTFHAYCKKVLHQQNGKVELVPYLTKIIEEDAGYLNLKLRDFEKKFQMLDETSSEIAFYLKRGDYYDAVAFNDSVYRLYRELKKKSDIIPEYNQILIDEFQDFNPLEVAFINELEKKGNIVIAGDDDQSVYERRCASPQHLREKYYSGKYERFELPLCHRCPEVVVNATNALLNNAEKKGHLRGRVRKSFECNIYIKGPDSTRFPKIHIARCTTGSVVAKYVDGVIRNITGEDVEESWKKGREYTTVLVAGPRHYLLKVQEELANDYPQMVYKRSERPSYNVTKGYDLLLNDIKSNLGWRILVKFYFERGDIKNIIRRSDKGDQLPSILNNDFMKQQEKVVEIIRSIEEEEDFDKGELKKYTGKHCEEVIEYYSPKEKKEKDTIDKTKPSILLSSFVGCKGLSAGHVIIVGANDGSIPKDPNNIGDIEIAQFLVALTRTRKQCHIISNKWLFYRKNEFPNKTTSFLNWIPNDFIEDHGNLRASDI
ncbi:ATP-dependent DNA helicase Rep [subsurface metagenome]